MSVGASDHFYSDPAPDGARTLDDDITDIESSVSRTLAAIRDQSVGTAVSSTDATHVVHHLVPRTAHVRVNLERALRMVADGIETILDDDGRIQTLVGLGEDEVNERFRENFADTLSEIEWIEKLGVPRDIIEKISFIYAKEQYASIATNMRLTMRNIFNNWMGKADDLVRRSHNRALQDITRTSPRSILLEKLTWSTQPSQNEGAILPDCVALAVDQSGQTMPAMFSDWNQVAAIILPVSPNKLLVGAATEFDVLKLIDFNEEAARCSHDFFLSPEANEYMAHLHKLLGERATEFVEEGVGNAMEAYLTIMPKPIDEGAPIFPEDLIIQSRKPWQYELSLADGVYAESVEKLQNTIQGIVSSLSRVLPLHRLDGITIAPDCRAAVASIDRRYQGASALDSASKEVGRMIAKRVAVHRGDRWKDRIILDANAAIALLSEESDTVDQGLYPLVKQLAEVALSEVIEHRLPGIWMNPIRDPLHNFLYPSVEPAIFGYIASHISAGIGNRSHNALAKRELFIKSLKNMKEAILTARLQYRYHGNLSCFLEVAMPQISYNIQIAAELLGHCAASDIDYFDDDGELKAELSDVGLQLWLPIFHEQLESLRLRLGRWESFDEFLALDVNVERLMWQFGLIPWLGQEGVSIAIPLGTDIENLLKDRES